jgi:hypothetical protein
MSGPPKIYPPFRLRPGGLSRDEAEQAHRNALRAIDQQRLEAHARALCALALGQEQAFADARTAERQLLMQFDFIAAQLARWQAANPPPEDDPEPEDA